MIALLWHWIEVHTGTVNEGGPYYGFWSGFGSDIGEVTLIAGVVAVYQHNRCATCHRLGVHKLDTGQKTCHKHTTRVDHDRLTEAHRDKYPDHLAHQEAA